MTKIKEITSSRGKRATSKREEIIRHAYQAFYGQGFHATGVDVVIANSGISKRTLYKYFRTKEALIAAAVEHYQHLALEKIITIISARHTDPSEQILGFFDLKEEDFSTGNFAGCFALNAKLEFESKDSGIEKTCSSFYTQLEEYIAALCAKTGCETPKITARKIIILFSGAIVLGQIHHDSSTINSAKSMAKTILEIDKSTQKQRKYPKIREIL